MSGSGEDEGEDEGDSGDELKRQFAKHGLQDTGLDQLTLLRLVGGCGAGGHAENRGLVERQQMQQQKLREKMADRERQRQQPQLREPGEQGTGHEQAGTSYGAASGSPPRRPRARSAFANFVGGHVY